MKSWPEQRVLVTGGAGFIGSALVWALNLRGCERVVVCDRLGADEKWRNLTPLRFEDYLEADDLRQRLTAGATGNFDTVFHLGACSSTTEVDAAFLIRNNYEFTKHLFDLHAKRAGFLDQIVGLKYFNVFGPNEDHKGEMRSLVHKATSQARQEGVIRLFKSYRPDFRDGEQQRDFLYVKDAVAMTLHLASTPSAAGLFNLGSGAARTWIDLANAVFASLACPPRIEFIEMPEQLRGKYQYHTCADLAKLRHSGFDAPLTPLEEAVRDYVRAYLLTGARLGDDEHESSSARKP
jgi:ADP-L-glycero-D-manno-heptose 6-epimerase